VEEAISNGHAQNDDDDEYNLKYPSPSTSTFKKLQWYVLLPIRGLLYFIMPNFRSQPNIKRLAGALAIIMAVLGAATYCIMWWMNIVYSGIGMAPEIMGINFGSVGFSAAYIYYQLELFEEDRERDYLLSFKSIGCYKIGFGVGFSYFLGALMSSSGSIGYFPNGFQLILILYGAIVFANMLAIFICRLRILKTMWYIYFGCTFGYWILTWALCTQISG